MQGRRDGIQHQMVRPQSELTVSPDRFEVTGEDIVLVTELLLLDRCVESMREMAPAARNLQARIFAHVDDQPMAAQVCETMLTLVRHFLEDSDVKVLPVEVGGGPARAIRYRPSMGWVQAS